MKAHHLVLLFSLCITGQSIAREKSVLSKLWSKDNCTPCKSVEGGQTARTPDNILHITIRVKDATPAHDLLPHLNDVSGKNCTIKGSDSKNEHNFICK